MDLMEEERTPEVMVVSCDELKVDERLTGMRSAYSAEARELLEKDILKYGIRNPLVVWNGTIIDGHARYEVAKRHNLPVPVREMPFRDEEEVIQWTIRYRFMRSITDSSTAKRMLEVIHKEAGVTEK